MGYLEFLVVKVLGALVVPPGGILILGVLALVLLPLARGVAVFLFVVTMVSLYALGTGFMAGTLERSLYVHPALAADAELPEAGAIVVLGAGSYRNPPEYGGSETVGPFTLERLRYAASLHRRTGLPLLLSGGPGLPGTPVDATAMARALEDDFGIGVRFVEDRSRNTAENAVNSAKILIDNGISRIVLVTHAVHMARAVRAFESRGLEVVPAPTVLRAAAPAGLGSWLPSASALSRSAAALHEHVGLLWYRLRS